MYRTTHLTDVIANYSGLSAQDVRALLGMTPEQVIADSRFTEAVDAFDTVHLAETLPQARAALDAGLPAVAADMQAAYDMDASPMSAYTLGNWLVGFAEHRDGMPMLLDVHRRLPKGLFADFLPDLLALYDAMAHHAADWQRTMAVIAIPLVAPYSG